ncbi:MAG: flavin reductase [Phycisphaerales bacterium]|nr:flavin reductase [Phycisphaerales bacterium]
MEIDTASIGRAERYKLLIGGIVPRPIAFVSTVDAEGWTNLAPFSFFTAIGSDPMMLMFCPANKEDGSEKDTLRNAKPVSEGGDGGVCRQHSVGGDRGADGGVCGEPASRRE